MENVNIAIFASGNGTNAENIIRYFSGNINVNTKLVLTNKKDAYVIKRAEMLGVRSMVFDAKDLKNGIMVDTILETEKINLIILAGFLLKVPDRIVAKYRGRIINIHPALLPKYGGKGMYGTHVHQAVINDSEKESGITIHLVDEVYDNGEVLFRAKCTVLPEDTADSLADKIHRLEREFFPQIIENYINSGRLS